MYLFFVSLVPMGKKGKPASTDIFKEANFLKN